jgi:hypothetical protein
VFFDVDRNLQSELLESEFLETMSSLSVTEVLCGRQLSQALSCETDSSSIFLNGSRCARSSEFQ